MRAYSTDLRERILYALHQGASHAQVAALFHVSLSTIKRYLKQHRQTGHLAAQPIPGRPARYGAALDAELPAQLAAHPDATLEHHCPLWEQAHEQHVSTAPMSRAITRLGWTRKKRRLPPASAANRRGQPGAISSRPSQPSV